MPLFFLLAGFFCALLWQKSGTTAFFHNRMRRIAVPLLLFLPLLLLLMTWVMQFGLSYVKAPSPFLQFIARMTALSATAESQTVPLSTMHLWFLYHLLFLYLLAWCGRILISQQLSNWLLSRQPKLQLLLLIVAAIPALYAVSVPFPAPEWIFPALWALWFYGLFFFVGYAFFVRPDLLQQFDADRQAYLVLGGVSYGFYYYLLPTSLLPDHQPQGMLKLCITVFSAITAVLWTFSALLYARRGLDRRSALLRYLTKTSYWVYLIHLPLLFFIQFLLTDLAMPISVKFLLSSFGTLAICLLSFHLLVSWNRLATWLGSR